MVVFLPSIPQGSQTDYKFIPNMMDLKPTMGGPTQRIGRLGDRYSVAVTARSMTYSQGLAFIASLNQGFSDSVVATLPQSDSAYFGSPGTPVINGGSQSGKTIIMRGFSAGYVAQNGQMFSISSNGFHCLYQVTSTETADSFGNLTLPINPMLKIPPNDGDTCEFATPKIQGFLDGNQQAWTLNMAQGVGLNFSITELQ